jgi:hypothetical protein
VPLSVSELGPALQHLFGDAAERLARECGFCLRSRKINGPVFAKALTFGLLKTPDATLQGLADFAEKRLGVCFSPQALDQRFTPPAALFLAELLQEALSLAFQTARPALLPVLRRFGGGVYLRDATLVPLPSSLAPLLPGRTGRGGPAAALKLVLGAELTSGLITAASVLPGRANEKSAEAADAPLPEGALVLEDMGFLSGERLQEYAAQGAYFLTRVPAWAAVFDADGTRVDLAALLGRAGGWYVERDVRLFHGQKLPVRLLATRLSDAEADKRRARVRKDARGRGRKAGAARLALCGWNVLVTNAPAEKLGVYEAFDVRRVRWQIELGFKALKSKGGGIDRTRGDNPWRALCGVYAKLLGAVVRSWAVLAAGLVPLRHSGLKAAARVRRLAGLLVEAVGRLDRLGRVIRRLARAVFRRCAIQRRRAGPSTLDRLAAHDRELDPDGTPP